MYGTNGDNLAAGIIDGHKVLAVVKSNGVYKAVVRPRVGSVNQLYTLDEDEGKTLTQLGY